ncbi:MAG: cation diffusion facilitator family transporter [Defluviitaleaceae bacterium]|nr:cation diffusion facilitator family transporter [Defluviitaleaceae bacterium]MCL2263435.1 cation diffusion facilitator family transporter [Defluviitaleaceae bacterium]
MEKTNEQIAMTVARNSIIVNIGLSGFKLFAGIFGNSAAMISDAVHSITDLVSTVIVIIGIKLANRKEDNDHQYGHERFECVATLALAALIFAVGIGIGWAGIERIYTGEYVTAMPGQIALVAAVLGIVVKEGIFWYVRGAAKKIDSGALMADAWHSRADGISSVGSFIGILGARMGFPILDSVAAIVICLFILKTAVEIAIDSLGKMTDRACDDETAQAMRKIILSDAAVVSIDAFRTRIFGNRIFVDVEIGINSEVSFKEAHNTSHRVHDEIEREFPKVKHCKVHANPVDDMESE